MMNKNELRLLAKEKRKSLDTKKASESIVKQILELQEYKQAKNILFFYPLNHEINLLPLCLDSSKNFFLPKVQGEKLLVCPYKLNDALEESSFKTQEPKTSPIDDLSLLDIVFIPALMTDKQNNRLGYGGGFYDKFLKTLPNSVLKIVPIYKELTTDTLPYEPFDIKADLVIKC